MNRLAARPRDDAGTTAVEFALVLPLVVTLIGATLVFALHMLYGGLADYAARQGLHRAVVHSTGGFATDATVKQKIDNLYPTGLLGPPSTVTITNTGSGPSKAQGDLVEVTVTYTVPGVTSAAKIVGFLPGPSLESLATITRTARGRRE